MKYIVTPSLNTDNILATESISPQSFYGKRDFGYQSFFSLPQLDFENQLVLFSKIPDFQIEDAERENHPLILEIEDEEQLRNAIEVATVDDCKIFTFNDTIRINPTNCKLLFFSDKAKVLSRQNCMDSKLNKLINYYKFETVNASSLRLEDLVAQINNTKITNQTVDFRDNLINRAKGFIYGYYIGCSKELLPETADVLSKQKRIYDIVSAKLNNKGSDTELLDKELAELDKSLSENDPAKQKCRELWDKFVYECELPIDKFNAALQKLGVERDVKNQFANKRGIVFCPDLKNSLNLANYRSTLGSYVSNLIWSERKIGINISNEINISESFGFELVGDDENIRMFNMMVKIVADLDIDNLRTKRFDIINFFGKAIGDFFKQNGKTFEDSPERNFIVSLAKNVRSATPFNLHDIDNIVLQSLAAFILKGEDFDSLVDFLAVNAIPTYKYALALWGAVIGYVGMSRPLLEKEIKMSEFFPQVWKLTTGREMIGNLEVQTYQPIVFKSESEKERTLEEAIFEDSVTNNDSFKRLIWNTFEKECSRIRKNKAELKEELNKALLANGNNQDCSLFFTQLAKYPFWEKKSTAWKNMQQKICPDYNERVGEDKGFLQKGIESLKNFFSSNSSVEGKKNLLVGQYFYCDPNAWFHIEPLISDKNTKSKILEEVRFIQDAYQKGGYAKKDGTWVKCEDTDNKNVIYHFYNIVKKKYDTKLVDSIVTKLKDLYNVK